MFVVPGLPGGVCQRNGRLKAVQPTHYLPVIKMPAFIHVVRSLPRLKAIWWTCKSYLGIVEIVGEQKPLGTCENCLLSYMLIRSG